MKTLAFFVSVCLAGIWFGWESDPSLVADDRLVPVAKTPAAERKSDPQAIFKRRILPIMNSPKASSCTECHLSGVELSAYIHSDQATTFAALRKDGLINVKDPAKSKILTFIARKPDKPNPITDKIRKQEYEAFKAWLSVACKDPELLKAAADDKNLATKVPAEVIRHARKDRVLASFLDNIWSSMGRCISCHSPNKNQRLIKKHGDAISWVVPNNPQATLDKLLEGGNIDLDDPKNSPVVTKPAGLAKHGGGPKFLPGGEDYKKYLVFLQDFAAIKNGKYKKKADLPKPQAEVSLLSKHFLRILGMPEKWHMIPARVDIYRWDFRAKKWSQQRWATGFGPIQGKRKMWQNIFNVTAATGSAREKEIRKAKTLPPGRYLAKIYIDFDKKTKKNPEYEMGEKELAGQVEFRGRWQQGFRTPKIVRAPLFPRKPMGDPAGNGKRE